MKCDHSFSKASSIKVITRAGLSLLLAMMLAGGVAGCSSHSKPNVPTVTYSPVTTQELRQDDLHELKAAGVQVIRLGETYRIVITTNRFFYSDSANLLPGYSDVLDTLVRLLNSYHVVTVRVAAYSDNVRPGVRKDALTQRQASVIQQYLSAQDIAVRLIYADGEGAKHPVAANSTWKGRNFNRRIEISFQYIPTTLVYE